MKEVEKEYRKAWPFVTREQSAEIVIGSLSHWISNRPDTRPYLGFDGASDVSARMAAVRESVDPETVRRRNDFVGTVDHLLHVGWLCKYDDASDLGRPAQLLGFPTPTYRYPVELAIDGRSLDNALQELWQRDVGNAMPALALGAHLFPDRAELCIERLKALVLSSIEFPTWGARPDYVDMDLSCSHLARGIAIAYDWHPSVWSDSEKARIFTVLRERVGVLLRGAYGEAFWARAWTENHCSNAFASMGIAGAAFLSDIPEAAEWLAAGEAGTRYSVEFRPADGSVDEGIPYWSYGMSFLLQYIELTKRITAADTLYDLPHMRNGGVYRLHSSAPDLSGALTYGDAPARDYYGPSNILYALAGQYHDESLQWLGDAIPFRNGGPDIDAWSLLWRDPSLAPVRPAELPLDFQIRGWGVAITRSGWGDREYLLTVKAGFMNRNHGHLDAGALLFAWGGEWLIEAPGYGRVGPGFWDVDGPRWTYYSNSTQSHSTLLIDGANQRIDMNARGEIIGFESAPDYCYIDISLSEAYVGGHRIRRQILHRRTRTPSGPVGWILVLDEIDAASGSGPLEAQWMLQPGRAVSVEVDGTLTLRGRLGVLQIRSLAGPGCFTSRRPTAPNVDIPEEAIRTMTLTDTGSRLAFAVLLRAGAEDSHNHEEAIATIENWEPGNRRIVLTGPGFTDVLSSDRASIPTGR